MKANFTVSIDLSGLENAERNLPGVKAAVLQAMAQNAEGDIKMNFSQQSPSPAGQPPGVDTGMLKSSITAQPDGRDWIVGDGVDYGVHLEFGTVRMAARPFMRPAAARAARDLPGNIDGALFENERIEG